MLSSRACLVHEESWNGEGELLGYVVSVGRGRVCLEHSDDAGSRARQPRARECQNGEANTINRAWLHQLSGRS